MAGPSAKLAESLEKLHQLQTQGYTAIRSSDISRADRERLVKNGFLKEVMKGWYVYSRPDEPPGESTAWYASYWKFCSAYLNYRFGKEWCISPEQSLLLHAENWTIPQQLIIHAPNGDNKTVSLPHNTSLFCVRYKLPSLENKEEKQGIQLFSLTSALIAAHPKFFVQHATDARTALVMITDISDVLIELVENGHSQIAGRLAGAFRNIGKDEFADRIINTMRRLDYDIREKDPFISTEPLVFSSLTPSPYVRRLGILWAEMRETIISKFPPPAKKNLSSEQYLKDIEAKYTSDAYHSLSIEGYDVSKELIERVKSGNWNPDNLANDREHKNALAARGYWQAFQFVKLSIEKILLGENPGKTVAKEHIDWYQELFGPCVIAGILKKRDLVGYRRGPVYIRHSMHVPPNRDAVSSLMSAFFELLSAEENAAVRVVLGHFIFVYIHPYMDGNGRMGRFLMNAMCAAGGYPWTIVPVDQRTAYMQALEAASTKQDIAPFCDFLGELVKKQIGGK